MLHEYLKNKFNGRYTREEKFLYSLLVVSTLFSIFVQRPLFYEGERFAYDFITRELTGINSFFIYDYPTWRFGVFPFQIPAAISFLLNIKLGYWVFIASYASIGLLLILIRPFINSNNSMLFNLSLLFIYLPASINPASHAIEMIPLFWLIVIGIDGKTQKSYLLLALSWLTLCFHYEMSVGVTFILFIYTLSSRRCLKYRVLAYFMAFINLIVFVRTVMLDINRMQMGSVNYLVSHYYSIVENYEFLIFTAFVTLVFSFFSKYKNALSMMSFLQILFFFIFIDFDIGRLARFAHNFRFQVVFFLVVVGLAIIYKRNSKQGEYSVSSFQKYILICSMCLMFSVDLHTSYKWREGLREVNIIFDSTKGCVKIKENSIIRSFPNGDNIYLLKHSIIRSFYQGKMIPETFIYSSAVAEMNSENCEYFSKNWINFKY